MKAIDRPFTKIINGCSQFVIPVFQRDYSWTEEQCQQLWDDVVRIGAEPSERGHFIGSVVYIPSGDSSAGFTRWLLIDGQQRVTTLTLLVLALRRHLLDTGWTPSDEDGPTAKRLEAYFLKNLQEEGSRSHKLVLRRNDQEALAALLDDAQRPDRLPSRVLENYESFLDDLRTSRIDPAIVYRGIGKLVVVDVTLDRHQDDPQMIFESLNSTGVSLTESDLIRNYILMGLPEKEQTRLYERYWAPIELLFRGSEHTFDAFARDYMAFKTGATRQIRHDTIYQEFRTFWRGPHAALACDAALEEMLRLAGYYAAFSLGHGTAVPSIQDRLNRLHRLGEVAALLVMKLFDCHERDRTLTLQQFGEALELLESYIVRRAVCGSQTRAYWQTFAGVTRRLDPRQPLLSLKVELHRLRDSYRFPDDEQFGADLQRRNIYEMRNCHYLLDCLENHGSKEPTDTKPYTVEHILPQNPNLRREWQDMLGPDFESVQQRWVHRLGNLTLTGYNSTYSDRPFEES